MSQIEGSIRCPACTAYNQQEENPFNGINLEPGIGASLRNLAEVITYFAYLSGFALCGVKHFESGIDPNKPELLKCNGGQTLHFGECPIAAGVRKKHSSK